MASLHFCRHFTAHHQTHQSNLPTTTNDDTNITTSFKLNAASLTNLGGLKSSPMKHTHLITHIENSVDPSSSSSSTKVDAPLKIGIIGFGNFGQFIGKAFKKQGHNVIATSRSDYSDYCQDQGFEFFRHINALCEAQPDIVLLASSIPSTEKIVRGIPFHKLKPDTVFVDVLSVKQFPKNLFLEVLPSQFGILCTHPMFGPNTAKTSWEGSRFVYEKVRIVQNSVQEQKCAQFLSIFEDEINGNLQGCEMVEMTCDEHDRYAAGSQFVTHTVGRILANMDLKTTPINTKGYDRILELTDIYSSHDFDLYYGLFAYNVHAKEQIENLEKAFDAVKAKLFGRLEDNHRKQMEEKMVTMENDDTNKLAKPKRTYFLPNDEELKYVSSFAIIPSQSPNQEESPSSEQIHALPKQELTPIADTRKL